MRARRIRTNRSKKNSKRKGAGGFISKGINKAIDKLPFEAHLKGYNYCGPGTRLKERLARGDQGINPLDEACKLHDIAYAQYSDSDNRRVADKELAERAWARVKSTDAKFGEKAAAWFVTNAMKVKSKIGGGGARKRRRKNCSKRKGKGIRKTTSTRQKKRQHRGGVLPLLPIFAGLSAIGSLAGGASAVAKVIRDGKNANTNLAGRGLYIRPYKSGSGAGGKRKRRKKRSGKKK